MDWLDNCRKLCVCLRDFSIDEWRLEEKDGNASLWNGDVKESEYLHPQLLAYLLGGILLGYGYKTQEGYADQVKKRSQDLN